MPVFSVRVVVPATVGTTLVTDALTAAHAVTALVDILRDDEGRTVDGTWRFIAEPLTNAA